MDPHGVLPPQYGPGATRLMGLAPVTLPVLARISASRYDAHQVSLDRLVPSGARLTQIWFLAGRGPGQILIRWDPLHPRRLRADETPHVRWGMTLWVPGKPLGPGSGERRWLAAAVPVLDYPSNPDVRIADVTSDGQQDAIVQQYPGTNHGCGPHQGFAGQSDGRTIRVFAATLCETDLYGRDGLLRIRTGDYRRGDSVCCPYRMRYIARHWTGQRFVTARTTFKRLRYP